MPPESEEHVVLVDAAGADAIGPDGRTLTLPKLEAHVQGRRHRAISVFIFSSRGEVMLQQRAGHKYHCPGLWSNTCCTHPRLNEIPADAARRRLQEEMGLDCAIEEVFCFAYSADVGNGLVENEFDHVFFGYTDEHPMINPDEADDWRWCRVDALGPALAKAPEQYAPWLRYCYPKVRYAYRERRTQKLCSPLEIEGRDPVFAFLCVEDFLQRMVDARSLATAFELGLIDCLLTSQTASVESVCQRFRISAQAMKFMLGLLAANQVLEYTDLGIKLTAPFMRALHYRGLMEAKLAFANFVVPDFIDSFTALLASPGDFQRRARVFDLFSYNRCVESTRENYTHTRKWVQLTTALTRYEAPVCMHSHDFGSYRKVMDIGGNSGEFMLQVCRRFPKISATVFDLPVVCDVGRAHVQSEQEADRIAFLKGNALVDNWPLGADLITFKSMLHDWPEENAAALIAKARQALNPGGNLLIFERGPVDVHARSFSYAVIPFLLFFNNYRSPQVYRDILENNGFGNINIQKIELEMTFYLTSAQKI